MTLNSLSTCVHYQYTSVHTGTYVFGKQKSSPGVVSKRLFMSYWFIIYFVFSSVCVCVYAWVGMCAFQSVHVTVRRQLAGVISFLSPGGHLGLELRLSGLVTSAFT